MGRRGGLIGVGGLPGSSDQPYQQQENDQSFDNDVTATPMRPYIGAVGSSGIAGLGGGMVNRLARDQDRWQRQLEIQRKSVYDRHTMLN